MHGLEEFNGPQLPNDPNAGPWYKELSRYHWFVLGVSALGWLFDCLDQQLFILTRPAAIKELLPYLEDPVKMKESVDVYSNIATSIFLAGWASGGLFFGILGDRWGRAKTMIVTILLYSLFTGLSAISYGFWDFAFYRFLTGLGVGGEFAVGVALVAEVMPARARPYTLGLLQALSALGNITAALIFMGFGIAEESGMVRSPWRIMFLIGALPAIVALLIRRRLKEPEQWQKASHSGVITKQLGSYTELLGTPLWRKHALLGLMLACCGVIGLWAIAFFTMDLLRSVQRKEFASQAISQRIETAKAENKAEEVADLEVLLDREQNPKQAGETKLTTAQIELKDKIEPTISGRLSRWGSYTSLAMNFGAFFGMFGFGALAQKIGRRPTFALALVAAGLSTASVFWFLTDPWQVFVLVPIMGFCQLSLFAGYAIYFPELFPTRLRSTGTSFCYNVGRFVAAAGPLVQAGIISVMMGLFPETSHPLRYAGVTMCSVFALGLFALPFLPETKDRPLPE